jgi:hypothetical protein
MKDIKVYQMCLEACFRSEPMSNEYDTSRFIRYVAAYDYKSALEYADHVDLRIVSIKELAYLRHWEGTNVSECTPAEH